jgi:aminoglycoside/choline kinase family phosphotransferase
LLDEELASGIVAAKQVQQRFQKERRIDPGDFKDALTRFQGDAHDVVNLLNDQFAEMRSDENAELVKRFTGNAHSLLDLVVELVNTSAELADQLAKSNLQKKQGKTDG